jgi:hypothetical protein
VDAHRNSLVRIGRWSILFIGVAATVLLLFVASYNFIIVRGFGGDYYANLGLFRGSDLFCAALATFVVAVAMFRQLPRIPQVDRPAMLLFVLGVAFGLIPYAYGTLAKDICLGDHQSWNITLMRCER